MLHQFAFHRLAKTGKAFSPAQQRIRCLAHIINLATQVLISSYSKAKHYNPHAPGEHVPDTSACKRDEVGLIRAITVKERSSSKRKELFRSIQRQANINPPKQLLIDMPVCWSSTYMMLDRAEKHKQLVDIFVYEIGRDEKDLVKRAKLDNLKLTEEEWGRAKLFLDLLTHADRAQQAFSSDQGPSLHLGLPALEALHKAWSSRIERPKYADFKEPLRAAVKKIEDYYDHMADSPAYIMAMCMYFS